MKERMTSCIIGGSGFIGRHLIEELLASGRKVITVGRSNFVYPQVQHYQVKNLFDEKINELLHSDIDEIIYLAYATKPKTSFDNPVRDIEENLAQAVHLFELGTKMGRLKKIIYISSGGTVYGNTGDNLIKEDHSKHPISPYGITKLTMEHFAYLFFKIYHLPVVIVRPSNAYGIGQEAREGQGFIAYAMRSISEKKEINIYGESGTIRDYIYVSDVAKAIRFCLDKALPGTTYNIGSQTGYSNLDIVHLLREIVDAGRYPVATKHSPLRPFDVNKNILDTAAIKNDTGWQPLVTIREGLAMTWDWFINQKQ